MRSLSITPTSYLCYSIIVFAAFFLFAHTTYALCGDWGLSVASVEACISHDIHGADARAAYSLTEGGRVVTLNGGAHGILERDPHPDSSGEIDLKLYQQSQSGQWVLFSVPIPNDIFDIRADGPMSFRVAPGWWKFEGHALQRINDPDFPSVDFSWDELTWAADPPISASCSVSPSSITAGNSATWSITSISGGRGPFAYSWADTTNTNNTFGSGGTPSWTKTYPTAGTFGASVAILASTGDTASANCSNNVTVTPVQVCTPNTQTRSCPSPISASCSGTEACNGSGTGWSGVCTDVPNDNCPDVSIPSGTISASPNPCSITSGNTQCASTISWSTTNTTNAAVCVDGSLFANATSGNQNAPWIQANHNYVFNLHNGGSCNGTVLRTVTVTATPPAPPPPPPPPTTVSGSCAGHHYECLSPPTSTNGTGNPTSGYTWTCPGSGSPVGQSASCSEAGAGTPSGTLRIRATMNGVPWTGSLIIHNVGLQPSGGSCAHYGVPIDFLEVPAGTYNTGYCSDGPPNSELINITYDASSQAAGSHNLLSGGFLTITFNFQTGTGNVGVAATLDGQPWTGPQFLTAAITASPYGAIGCTDFDNGNRNNAHLPVTFSQVFAGTYTFQYCSGGPPGATLANITLAPSQVLTAGVTKTFTFNFVTPVGNQAPVVDAGPDQTTTLPVSSVSLNGTVTDDGFHGTTVMIDAVSNTSNRFPDIQPMSGFVQGFFRRQDGTISLPTDSTVSSLRPQFWRTGGWPGSELWAATAMQVFGRAKVTWILSDPFESGSLPNPLQDPTQFDSYITTIVSGNRPAGHPIDYWDIYNEPELNHLDATPEQILSLYKRAHDLIRRADPQAKIVAPSFGWFTEEKMDAFLNYARQNNMSLDAISWHEINSAPHLVRQHITATKTLLRRHGFCLLRCPEIHINEYGAAANHLIPGWTVAWLSYLAQNQDDIDWLSRTCWTQNNEDDCFLLNGLLTNQNRPTPVYWIYRSQAEMIGRKLLSSTNGLFSSEHITTLAATSPQGIISILAGRAGCGQNGAWCSTSILSQANDTQSPPIPVTVSVTNFPAPFAEVRSMRIPNENILQALPTPIDERITKVSVQNHTLAIPIWQFHDGDAYDITVTPSSTQCASFPCPQFGITTTWSKTSGPGVVTFANANAVDTTATFSTTGTYVLRLTAADGLTTSSDTMTVTVLPQIPLTGTIIINATKDGATWTGPQALAKNAMSTPQGGPFGCADMGVPLPTTLTNMLIGSYAFAYCSGGPPNTTFTGITPNATQNLTQGAAKTFTFNFTSNSIFDYSLAANPNALTIQQGNSGSTNIIAALVTPPTQPVTLSATVSPLEASITTSFSSNPCTPTCTSTLHINTLATTPIGNYTVTITGDPLNRTTGTSITVTVTRRIASITSPTLAFSADLLAVPPGTGTTLRWTVGNDATSCTAGGDWNGSVANSNGNHFQPTGNLTSPKTYTLFCSKTGAADTPTQTVTITISTPPIFREISPQ